MKTHPLNVSYLVVGLVFLGIAGSWLLHRTGVVDTDGMSWLLPLTLVGAGVVGIVAFAVRGVAGGRAPAAPGGVSGPHGTDDDTEEIR